MRTQQSDYGLPVWNQPCIHAAPLPGTLENVMCVLGVEANPSREHCRDKCEFNVVPNAFRAMAQSAAENRRRLDKLVDKRARDLIKEREKQGRGLGDLVESAIDKLTFGKAKKLMEAKEKKTGKPCGCQKRKEALNAIGENIGLRPSSNTGSTEEPRDAS